MRDIEIAELLIRMFEERADEIEKIIDGLNSIDRDFLWDVDEDDISTMLSTMQDCIKCAKKELRRRK